MTSLLLLAIAALPPLSNDVRQEEAHVVVVGTISKIESREVKTPQGPDIEYTATLSVEKIEKEMLKSDAKSFTLVYRSTGKRPAGWTGPSGQHSYPKVGARIRAFARTDDKGRLRLLEPNGWEPAPNQP